MAGGGGGSKTGSEDDDNAKNSKYYCSKSPSNYHEYNGVRCTLCNNGGLLCKRCNECSSCHKIYNKNTITNCSEGNNHEYNGVKCTLCNNGLLCKKCSKCSSCGKVYKPSNDPKECNHPDTKEVVILKQTCTAKGASNIVCKYCSTILGTKIINPRHNYKVILDSTCTSEGIDKCTVCGKEMTIPVRGHKGKYIGGKILCEYCGEDMELIQNDMSGKAFANMRGGCNHNYTKKVVDKAATCKESGKGHYECTNCGGKGKSYTIDKLSTHAYNGIKCSTGDGGVVCSICGHCSSSSHGKKQSCSHNYTKVVDKAANCSSSGSGHYKCTKCGAKGSTYSIPKNSTHAYNGLRCSTGDGGIVCSICGHCSSSSHGKYVNKNTRAKTNTQKSTSSNPRSKTK